MIKRCYYAKVKIRKSTIKFINADENCLHIFLPFPSLSLIINWISMSCIKFASTHRRFYLLFKLVHLTLNRKIFFALSFWDDSALSCWSNSASRKFICLSLSPLRPTMPKWSSTTDKQLHVAAWCNARCNWTAESWKHLLHERSSAMPFPHRHSRGILCSWSI